MKLTEKAITLALMACMALALCACGGNATTAASSSASNSEAASTASAADSAAEGSEKADIYENEYFGISLPLADGWSFVDDKTVAQDNVLAGANDYTMIDSKAVSADGKSDLLIAIENATDETAGQDADAHLDAQVRELTDSASEGSVTYQTYTAPLEFDGSDRTIPAAFTTLTRNGQELHVCQIVVETNGDFLDIVVQGPTEDVVKDAISGMRLILE